MGIRGQLTLLVPSIVAIALGAGAFLELEIEQHNTMVDLRMRNEKILRAIGATVAVHLAQNDMVGLNTAVAELSDPMQDLDLLELAVLDNQGEILAHSQSTKIPSPAMGSLSQKAIKVDGMLWEPQGDAVGVSVPAISGTRLGTVTARYSLKRVLAHLEHTKLRLLTTSVLLFCLVGAVLFLGLDRLVVSPLRTLQHTVRKMGEGQLSARVPVLRGVEMGELGNVINRMAAALQHERENLEKSITERTRELQEANARLERLAVTDGLTGVFNHRRFQDQLKTETLRSDRHNRPLSVLMVDVDFFKKVNDALGHPAGDELLRRLAEVLSVDLRQTDFIARYGGEEFVVLLPETSKGEAMQVAERMRSAVEVGINTPSTSWPLPVTVSIGVATYPEDGKAGDQVVSVADQSMYVAKRQGRNRVIGARGALG